MACWTFASVGAGRGPLAVPVPDPEVVPPLDPQAEADSAPATTKAPIPRLLRLLASCAVLWRSRPARFLTPLLSNRIGRVGFGSSLSG